jgi:phage-related protein
MTAETVTIISIIVALTIFLIESYLIEEKKRKALDKVESGFLLSAISFEQYKYQMLQIMELVYQKAGENDEQFIKDFEKIKESIVNKCNESGDLLVKNMKNSIERETKYNNWKEAITFTEVMLKKIKNDNSRKGD